MIVQTTRKSVERKVKQEFILAEARKLFAAKGVENTSMDDIAAAAEYTRRTLYAYFKSRDEICLRVLMEDNIGRWEMQKRAIARVESGLDKLCAWAVSLYLYARENPQAMRLQLYWDFHGVERERIDPATFASFEQINDELADGLREIFRLGVADGSLRPDLKIDLCISQFLYSLRSIVNRALSPAYSFASFESDDYVSNFLEIFTRGIRNE